MSKSKSKSNIIKSVLFPCLLGFVGAISILCVYESLNPQIIPPMFLIFVFNAAMFIFYEKLRTYNKKWLSTLLICLNLFINAFTTRQLIMSQGYENISHLLEWFFKSGDTPLNFPIFTAALLMLFVPFISSTVFYFTNVRYNSFYLMLTCMTTFALYAKTFTNIPFLFPSLIIALFLLISIEQRWYKVAANKAVNYRTFVITGVCFVAIAAYIAGLFPPVEDTPYREQFDELISGQNLRDFGGMARSGLVESPFSGSNNPNANMEQVLFMVEGDNPPAVLRRTSFDEWNGEAWQRKPDTWESGVFFEGDTTLRSSEMDSIKITKFVSYPITFYPMPPNPLRIDFGGENTAFTIRSEFFIANNSNYRNPPSTYTVEYSESYDGNEYAGYYFREEYKKYLETGLELSDYPGRNKVRELAREITSGYSTNHDKARAIERYFYNGDFTYDLDFVPRSKAVDYFLFDSKTGTCSDFATAMTILARESGIHARYVEGFIVDREELNRDGTGY